MASLLPLTRITRIASIPAGVRRSGERTGPRFCVCGPVRDLEEEEEEEEKERIKTVSSPFRRTGLSPLFLAPLLHGASSSPPSPSPTQQQRDCGEDKHNYYVNLGYAIRALREDFPHIFQMEPRFDIYRDDIVFKDPLNTFVGIDNYKRIFWALRLNGRIFFKALWINIVSVWQPVENIIMIRWIVHGITRVPWESHGRFDGTSKYKLDKNGKIFEHWVDNIALNSPPTRFKVLPVEELIQSLGCPSTPRPTYFKVALLKGISIMPFLLRFSWVRCYLAFYLTLAWHYAAKG